MSDEPTQFTRGGDVPDPDCTRSTGPTGNPEALSTAATASFPPRIGRYTILRVLGQGGMGTVYEARQDQPSRVVALKVIRAGCLSAEMLRRFEHESQVLGRLQHAGIAQVYEAGTVQDERGHPMPFFAMEFIRGVPLTEFAASRKLGTRERLELIARICDAVYHAHQKGVIHRDLKPGNILVDESGQPKVLDFGIARATDSDIQKTTMQTDIGQLIGTVPYMSPEQAGGQPGELDTRSDVYALGVIAYELLAGRLPYNLQRKMIHEIARIIKEEEPTRLSSINRTLRGDVETIVAKALEKDKVRRYQSAESLASDIRRYLKSEPIAARPASTWYQVAKFARRNTGLVAGLGVAFVLLIAGLIGTSYGMNQAVVARDLEALARTEADKQKDAAVKAREAEERERKTAVAQRDKAEKVAEFMSDILKGVGPSVARARDITMLKEMMDAAAARIEKGDLKDAPEAELRLRGTIGFAYVELAQFPDATRMLEPAVTLARSLPLEGDESAVWALDAMARLQSETDQLVEAVKVSREALDMLQRVAPGDEEHIALLQNNLALRLQKQGDLAGAEPLYRKSLATRRRLFPGDREDIATSLNSMSYLLRARGDRAGAESFSRESLAMFKRLFPGDHPDVATGLNNLGVLLLQRGDLAGAEPNLRESLEMMKRLHPGDHPSVATLLGTVASVVYARGNTEGAVPFFRESLEMKRRLFPGDHSAVALGLSNLGRALQRLGDLAGAEPVLRESLDMNRRLFPGDHPNVADGLGYLGDLLNDRADPTEAERLCRESLEMDKRLFPKDHPDVAESLNRLAGVLVFRGDLAGAEPLAREGAGMSERTNGKDHWRTGLARLSFGRALTGLNKFAEAESELIECERVLSSAQGVPPGRHAQCVGALAALYGSWDKALPGKGYDAKAMEWRAKLEAMQAEKPKPGAAK